MAEQPDVVDGQFTPAFYRRVAALDEAARKKMWEKPKCPLCHRPMVCDQKDGHFTCLGLVDGG